MSPKKFWKLSFYEWSLWLNAIVRDQQKREQDQQLAVILQRDWMALYVNSNTSANAEKLSGTDFYPLPGDEVKKKTEFSTPEQLEQEMKRRVRKIRTK